MVKRDSNFNPVAGSRGLNRRSEGIADWEQADGGKLKHAISTAASTGGALRFGYSRDGGAYAIGIYGDGSPYTEFIKPSEDIDKILDDLIDLFEEIADDVARKATEPKPRKGLPSGQ